MNMPDHPGDPFVVYSMADGSPIDEYAWVTELDWFDDRSGEIRLFKHNYVLISRELVVLPDPYPIEDEDEDDVFPPPDSPPVQGGQEGHQGPLPEG